MKNKSAAFHIETFIIVSKKFVTIIYSIGFNVNTGFCKNFLKAGEIFWQIAVRWDGKHPTAVPGFGRNCLQFAEESSMIILKWNFAGRTARFAVHPPELENFALCEIGFFAYDSNGGMVWIQHF